MARTNAETARIKPDAATLLTLRVVRRSRISPNIARVTLGGGDIADFTFLGYDQWFRFFIPVSEGGLERLPTKLDMLAYAKYLAISKSVRPVLRNYTVRDYRRDGPDGPELDIDFVIHGSAAEGTAGPAASWAQSCEVGDAVALLDEGRMFNLPADVDRVLLVADETGLPAVAGILTSLPASTVGTAIVEIPSAADAQDVRVPDGVELRWVVREDPHDVPGRAALAAAAALGVPDTPCYAWVVGEQSLAANVRRLWVRGGMPKERVMFCGYWKVGKAH
ncbi:siderophore-interacting protein [Plantibacter sp. VKM Ac-2876]|uniref:siderophore-interacting protein n=1 Tax=Plantibacter sp. VKM Ac-2876 TaxID=2783826 RepID=UPI00188B9474|nr:siderophore-interacting protein [Plantibacter sp. VKM Ac-2876]